MFDAYYWKGRPTSSYTKDELVEMLAIQSRSVNYYEQLVNIQRQEIIQRKYEPPPFSPMHRLFRWIFRLDKK